MRELVRQKRQRRSRTTLGVAFLTCRETRREIVPFARLGCALGVDYVQYRPLLTPSEDKYVDQHADYATDIIRRISRARKCATRRCAILWSKHKYDLVAAGGQLRTYGECHGHHFAAVIAADRKMYLCCHLRGRQQYCLGDLSRQSLRQIWSSPRRRRVYRHIDFRDCPFLCRCDSFNTILWGIAQPKPHINFL
ncbi:MAG TPA: SPASM domain-containing protein, partial [bacterium]|nr:SPASM domain-containing protein [bacterium]